ncbi:MAG: type II secretion system protein GspG [Candidatus Hinthialibacter sp.]
MNAQIRAKVSRVKSDIRALAQAHEMYYLDNNTYPPESEDNIFTGMRSKSEAGLFFLTSPVPYMSSLPHDPFQDATAIRFAGSEAAYETGVATRNKLNIAYNIFSRGPDMAENGLYSAQPFFGIQRNNVMGNTYSPTNGLVSNGDIYWYGGNPDVVKMLRIDGKYYNGNFPPNFAS